jgi:CBS domain-containing protein
MHRSQDYETEVVSVAPDTSCVEVADEMDVHTIGCVVVVEEGAPVGIITDRDLLCRVVAESRDPEKTSAADVMTKDPVTASRDDDVQRLLEIMRERAIRRVPVVEEGKLVGLITLDDLLIQLSSYLYNANQGILGGLSDGRRISRHRRRMEAREEALDEIRRQLSDLGDNTRHRVRERLHELMDRLGGTS